MNGFQYSAPNDVADALNCLDRELDDQDIKAVLINLCRRVADLESSMRQAVVQRDVMD